MKKLINHNLFTLAVIISTLIITHLYHEWGYAFAVCCTFLKLSYNQFDFRIFGLSKFNFGTTLVSSLTYAIALYFLVAFVFGPIIEKNFGKIDISSMDVIREDTSHLLFFLIVMWVASAFAEEVIFRGYFVKHLYKMIDQNVNGWIVSSIIISSLFGLSHYYQGVSGIILTTIIGFLFSIIFYFNRNNLTLVILTHGFFNTITVILIYLNLDT